MDRRHPLDPALRQNSSVARDGDEHEAVRAGVADRAQRQSVERQHRSPSITSAGAGAALELDLSLKHEHERVAPLAAVVRECATGFEPNNALAKALRERAVEEPVHGYRSTAGRPKAGKSFASMNTWTSATRPSASRSTWIANGFGTPSVSSTR